MDKWFPLISCDTVLALTRSQNLLHFLRLCPTRYPKLENSYPLVPQWVLFRLGNAIVRLCNAEDRRGPCATFEAICRNVPN